ncbi:Uncharacterized conserved protein YecE, DUF72 family [Desulfacinum hydrothermale DSM 13146]|uniref:Uncharacterized conserved protein YecE, DUF72 family n=1 Tax=Desulfacinum hydrothermale DSM 13146 TaxID=1121390 RepID=A0A1W1XRU0_9BACT|nr:DUF72 domain-containing protein [Desulfacinum hydrothermale]SMC26575.1 Uncharacterized conserved protein YecE, DUF72 family [Desulfacinum hydrothermale DSM 13146]
MHDPTGPCLFCQPEAARKAISRFVFRHLHPQLFIGTASDRYGGWIHQIYTPERYEGRIRQRTQRVGGTSFKSLVLPVESVREYFEHFGVLELDFTFYSPLWDPEGRPTRTYRTLREYAQHLPEDARVLLKVPQKVTARRLWQGRSFRVNPTYLNPALFTKGFYEPAVELLGDRIRGFIFEQEYQKKAERPDPNAFALELDRFFGTVPPETRYHLELRTEALHTPEVFRVLAKHRVESVLSHWTWLPPLMVQFRKRNQQFTGGSDALVIRLMTPRGMRYEDAYAKAHPFDRLVPGMALPRMFEETAAIATTGLKRHKTVYVVINNRAGGNAPLLARQLAFTFLKQTRADRKA